MLTSPQPPLFLKNQSLKTQFPQHFHIGCLKEHYIIAACLENDFEFT